MPAPMTIGRLGHATGVAADTIRYYEKIGLLPAPERTPAGYRVYTPAHVRHLHFIRRARELGLSCDAVRELLSLASDDRRPCASIDRLVREHIHELDHKLADLLHLRDALQDMADSCRGGGNVRDCRILEAMTATTPPVATPAAPCTDTLCSRTASPRS